MQEKKLTDEEIVKTLALCTKSRCDDEATGDCPLKRDECCQTIMAINALNLIHRLQSENAGLKERGEIVINSLHETIDKQKAEIERLTEENAILKENPPILVGRSLGKTIRAKLLAFDKMKEQNAELQKQVEKLKEENEYLDIVARQSLADYQTVQVQVDELTAFKNEAISMSLYGKGRKDGEEVAVKDTAKEIWEHIVDCFLMRSENKYFFKEWLQDRYGVEVE